MPVSLLSRHISHAIRMAFQCRPYTAVDSRKARLISRFHLADNRTSFALLIDLLAGNQSARSTCVPSPSRARAVDPRVRANFIKCFM